MADPNSPHHNQSKQYKPRSPDLSQFRVPELPRLQKLPSYPLAPDGGGFPPGYTFSPRGSYDASPYFSPQTQQPLSYFGTSDISPETTLQGHVPSAERLPLVPQNRFDPSHVTFPPDQLRNSSHNLYQASHPNAKIAPLAYNNADMARLRARKPTDYNDDKNEVDFEGITGVASFTNPYTVDNGPIPTAATSYEKVTAVNANISVKTTFPVARIKRIMQADDDVGKVAIATPPAVSKALELFMVSLVLKGAEQAKAEGTIKINANHLKAAILQDTQYDFLNEIVESTPDEKASKGRAKSDAKSEDSDGEPKPQKKKRSTKEAKNKDEDG